MNTKNLAAAHKRGLAVLAIATAFLQAPAAGHAAAPHADLRQYEAVYRGSPREDIAPMRTTTCADVVDAITGERGCATGGPSGGFSDRN